MIERTLRNNVIYTISTGTKVMQDVDKHETNNFKVLYNHLKCTSFGIIIKNKDLAFYNEFIVKHEVL